MFSIKQLAQPTSLEEAYTILTSRRNNSIIGGGAFLRLGAKRIATAVDLSQLKLDYIKAENGYIEIGALTNLREIEVNPLTADSFNGLLARAVANIIGVQLRTTVTVGASVYSRYGFSDLITALLALDTKVELYKAGVMSLEEFLQKPYEKDILTRLFIKQEERLASFQDLRNSASDYPVLNVAVSRFEGHWKIVIGARPKRAAIAHKASTTLPGSLSNGFSVEGLEKIAEMAVEELAFGTNARGTAQYREAIAKVLVKRGIMEVLQCK